MQMGAANLNSQYTEDSNVSQNPSSNDNLINISDDEEEEANCEEYSSDDSEEVSDSEDEKESDSKLSIDEQLLDQDNVKTISLSLEGAETSQETLNLEEPETISSAEELEQVSLSDDDNSESPAENNEDNSDGTLNGFVITKTDHTDEEEKELQLEQENVDDLSNHEEENELEVEHPTTDYSKLTKAQLKKLAQEKGLGGFNKLTKTGLVDLLSQNS